MKKRIFAAGGFAVALLSLLALTGCEKRATSAGSVLAVETFLADFARQVAGTRLAVRVLMPEGVDPHSYEPTPRDVATVAESRLILVNGAGMESFLQKLLASAGGQHQVVEASKGLTPRMAGDEPDPHFFLAPLLVVKYVENIRDGLSAFDPAGASVYASNADSYISQLRELDTWIRGQVSAIPAAARVLVTNHESLGYFADAYGFRVAGTIIPGVSTEASPSARQMAELIDALRAGHTKAVFLEDGTDPKLARQVAAEAGIQVVTELYTHSLTDAAGSAPSYIAMMRFNVATIVKALTGGAP